MITDYEKYQLQWMIDHGHSLQELMNVLADTANKQMNMGGNVYYIFAELFDIFKNEVGFTGEIWASEPEWKNNEEREDD